MGIKSFPKLHPRTKTDGFTLVELVITVGIIAVLGAIAIPAYQGYITSAKIKAAEAVLEQFPLLLENYRAETGSMGPDCNGTVICTKTYTYSENDSGIDDTVGDNIKIVYPDFMAKPISSNRASLYDYSLTISVTGCPGTCAETAQVTAIPVTSRGAPTGNIVSTTF